MKTPQSYKLTIIKQLIIGSCLTLALATAQETDDKLIVEGNLEVTGNTTTQGAIESTTGGFILPDGTVLDEASDLGVNQAWVDQHTNKFKGLWTPKRYDDQPDYNPDASPRIDTSQTDGLLMVPTICIYDQTADNPYDFGRFTAEIDILWSIRATFGGAERSLAGTLFLMTDYYTTVDPNDKFTWQFIPKHIEKHTNNLSQFTNDPTFFITEERTGSDANGDLKVYLKFHHYAWHIATHQHNAFTYHLGAWVRQVGGVNDAPDSWASFDNHVVFSVGNETRNDNANFDPENGVYNFVPFKQGVHKNADGDFYTNEAEYIADNYLADNIYILDDYLATDKKVEAKINELAVEPLQEQLDTLSSQVATNSSDIATNSSASGSELVSGDDNNLVAIATTGTDAATLSTSIAGQITIEEQGDISMGAFANN